MLEHKASASDMKKPAGHPTSAAAMAAQMAKMPAGKSMPDKPK